jgi:hypothetical protein
MTEIRAKVNKKFMDELRSSLGANTSTEVIREALTLLKWAIEEVRGERMIFSATEDGSDIHRLVSSGLQNVSTKE